MVNIFQNSKWEQEYAIEINNRFEILENMEDEDSSDSNINENVGAFIWFGTVHSNRRFGHETCLSEIFPKTADS